MSSDNANQLRHDVILHERVIGALLHTRQLRLCDPACALLAAYAGIFTTLARLRSPEDADHGRLLRLITASLATLDGRASSPPRPRPRLLLRDFYALNLLRAGARCATRSPQAGVVLASLSNALLERGILTARTGCARSAHALTHLLAADDAALIDRYRVARLLLF